jgi:hypothetical protein
MKLCIESALINNQFLLPPSQYKRLSIIRWCRWTASHIIFVVMWNKEKWREKARDKHLFFTINQKPNRTKKSVFGGPVSVFVFMKFGFRYRSRFSPHTKPKHQKTEYQTLSILKFDYSIMWTKCVKQLNWYSLYYMWCMMYL